MGNNDIKNAFERFSPTEEQKEHIFKSITGNHEQRRTPLRLNVKLAYSIAACLVLVAVAAAVLLSNPINNSSSSLPKPVDTQHYEANKPLENSYMPTATNKESFQGFILTAYVPNSESAHTDKQVLTPDVKVLLARYSLDMSSSPGLPFTVDLADGGNNSNDVKTIKVSADYGVFNRWNRKTGVVSSEGQSAKIEAGETIYWSPDLNKDEANVNKIMITVEAALNDTVIGRQSIFITQDKLGYYYATIGELEQL